MHFGFQGIVTGDTPNLLPPLVADPNVSIHEAKAFTANIRVGRRLAYHEGVTQRQVPPSEQTPFGTPERGGKFTAPGRASTEETIVSAQTVMDASARVHARGENKP